MMGIFENLLPFEMFKYSGAGNTFAIIIANDDSHFTKWESSLEQLNPRARISRIAITKMICSPVHGISTDGLVFLKKISPGNWSWDFYNSDGSVAEMCGNASRCVIAVVDQVLGENTFDGLRLHTSAGIIEGKTLAQGLIEVRMSHHFLVEKELMIDGERMTLLNTGVPHLVFQGDPKSLERSHFLRHFFELGPRGANVTNYVEISKGHLRAQSYERGVENFTLACGTGAVAAAFEYWRHQNSNLENQPSNPQSHQLPEQWIQVSMPGGDLEVFCSKDKKPLMRGPAILVGKFQLSNDVLAKGHLQNVSV